MKGERYTHSYINDMSKIMAIWVPSVGILNEGQTKGSRESALFA